MYDSPRQPEIRLEVAVFDCFWHFVTPHTQISNPRPMFSLTPQKSQVYQWQQLTADINVADVYYMLFELHMLNHVEMLAYLETNSILLLKLWQWFVHGTSQLHHRNLISTIARYRFLPFESLGGATARGSKRGFNQLNRDDSWNTIRFWLTGP